MSNQETYCRDMNNTEIVNAIKEIIEKAYSFQVVELVRSFLDNKRSYEAIVAILYDD